MYTDANQICYIRVPHERQNAALCQNGCLTPGLDWRVLCYVILSLFEGVMY